MAALRRMPASRPLAQSAGWRSTWPPHVVHSRSAMASAPRGQAPETSTAVPSPQCWRSAAAMAASSVQVREPVTSTRRAAAGKVPQVPEVPEPRQAAGTRRTLLTCAGSGGSGGSGLAGGRGGGVVLAPRGAEDLRVGHDRQAAERAGHGAL